VASTSPPCVIPGALLQPPSEGAGPGALASRILSGEAEPARLPPERPARRDEGDDLLDEKPCSSHAVLVLPQTCRQKTRSGHLVTYQLPGLIMRTKVIAEAGNLQPSSGGR
jgi:hypothetical protein